MESKELNKLYKQNWDKLSDELSNIVKSDLKTKPTNPLLLRLKDDNSYLNADIKIMIFGQETNNWGNDFKNDIKFIKTIYNDFFNTNHCFVYGGQFWNGIKLFMKKN